MQGFAGVCEVCKVGGAEVPLRARRRSHWTTIAPGAAEVEVAGKKRHRLDRTLGWGSRFPELVRPRGKGKGRDTS